MLKSTGLYFLFLLPLLSLHCVREVQIDLPEEAPKLVAIAHFTEGQPFKIELSVSQPIYSSVATELPSNADVTISQDGRFLDKLYRKYDGEDGKLYWQSRDTAFEGGQYSMIARVAGYPSIEASSSIPKYAPLAPILVSGQDVSVKLLDDGSSAFRVSLALEVQDMPEQGRFFALSFQQETEVFQFVNGQQVTDYTYQGKAYFLADGRTLSLLHNTPEDVVLINEKFWNDNRRTLFLDVLLPYDPETEIPRKIFVEWRTLSEEFYRYHLSLARQGSNLPLSDPDAVYNNISGGYGNFSGYSVAVDTILIPN